MAGGYSDRLVRRDVESSRLPRSDLLDTLVSDASHGWDMGHGREANLGRTHARCRFPGLARVLL